MPLIAEFDEFAVVGLLHVIGAHHFKYIAEQVELPVWVRGGRFRACTDEDAVWLRRQECEPGTRDRAQENEGDFAYHPRTFYRRLLPTKGAGINGRTVLQNSYGRCGCGYLPSAATGFTSNANWPRSTEIHSLL